MAMPLRNLPFKYKPIKYNFTKGRAGNKITWLIVHDTANFSNGADAMAHYRYFGSRYVGASAAYFVDDKQVIQIIGDSDTSWAVGDNQGHGRALNGATNRNSTSIELCVNKDGNYEQAYANLVELIKNLQKKFNIPNSRVARHYDVTRKRCAGSMFANNWAKWRQFKSDIQKPMILEFDLSKDSIATWKGAVSTPTSPAPVTSNVKTGDKVTVKRSATKYATGQNISNFVKGSTYTVGRLGKDRVLLKEITSWVNISDLEGLKATNEKPVIRNPIISVDGHWGPATTRALQRTLGTSVDGVISGQYRNAVTNAIPSVKFGTSGSSVVRALQKRVGAKADGYIGPNTIKSLQKHLGTYQDGIISRPSNVVREMQKRLNVGTL